MALLIALASSAAALVQPLVAQDVVDGLSGSIGSPGPVLLLAVLVLVSAVLSGASTWLVDREGERIVEDIRRSVGRHMVGATLSSLARHAPGDLVARATVDTSLVRVASTQGLVRVGNGAVGAVGAVAVMVYLDRTLTMVALGVMGVLGVVLTQILPKLGDAVTRAQAAVGGLAAALDRTLAGARAVKAFGTEDVELVKLDSHIREARLAGEEAARHRAAIVVTTDLAAQFAFVAVLGTGGWLAAKGSLELGALVGFLLALFHFTGPLGSLISGVSDMQEGMGALQRLRQVRQLDQEHLMTAPRPDSASPAGVGDMPAEVQFEDVAFRYDDASAPLHDVSFTVPAGEITALAGPSGGGKSTLMDLTMRLRELDSGAIRLGGVDVRDLSLAALRRQIGWVDQDATLLDGTIADNVRMGAHNVSDVEIESCLRQVKLSHLVDRGLGVNALVGHRGASLSGGERQRVAVARALVRRPAVLLLDEVTSQLDSDSEAALRDILDSLRGTITVLLVAHRPATIAMADHVVVISDGTSHSLRSPEAVDL
ncbi:ABC transporter ATP-binding protein [Knoellia sp. CPCC 206453]|uniref:ABC transporter ATP-binding protein n=1 Tax=Knoellia pratensis TaxID=3404796 RepID=UPI003607C8E7